MIDVLRVLVAPDGGVPETDLRVVSDLEDTDGRAATDDASPGAAAGDGVSRTHIIDDVKRVADRGDTADPPTRADYDRHGEWARQTVVQALSGGTWADTLDAAGLAPRSGRRGRRAAGRPAVDTDADADVVETGRSRRERRAMRSVSHILGEMQSADPGDDVVAHLDEGEVETYRSEGWPPSALAACEYCEADTESAVTDTFGELVARGEVYAPTGRVADGVIPLTR